MNKPREEKKVRPIIDFYEEDTVKLVCQDIEHALQEVRNGLENESKIKISYKEMTDGEYNKIDEV